MIDDLRHFENGKTLSVDLCIVGAGAAGITIAKELIGSGLRVCLVESGGWSEEDETQSLYKGESVGHPFIMDVGRYRVFGGSATRWGGRCAMFDPIDFEPREWINKSGWPIDYEALQPYYRRAVSLANFPKPWRSDVEEVRDALGIELPRFETEGVQPFVWRYSAEGYRRHFSWSRAYSHQLKADRDTHVLLHANLAGFTSNSDGSSIDSVAVRSLNEVTMIVKARAFALCCGGIENVRLILNAPENLQRRVNEFDNLGRYFAQHPRGCIATLKAKPQTAKKLQRLFTTFYRRRGVPYEIGFALSEGAQRKHRLVNASAAIYYHASLNSPWKSGARLRGALEARTPYQGMWRDVLNAVSGAGSVTLNLGRRLMLGRPAILPDPQIEIVVDLEQDPNPDSRVMLSAEKDGLGMWRAKVDWRISEIERRTARIFNGFIAQELKRLGYGETDASPWLTSNSPIGDDELYGTYHHIGTTRMSKHPRDGVVNEDCRSHGVQNLYFAGCSVFPTGGHANPTLTITALAVRLADHLRGRLGAGDRSISPSQLQ
jgi:choline dehydrogenase-like flavoprotein